MQNELTQKGKLLDSSGRLTQVGWSRQSVLDCNLENAHFYDLRVVQRFRIKRWDYYAIFTPHHFFSATIADLGYAGNIFVYFLDFTTGKLHEEGLVIPFGRGIILPRNSDQGESIFEDKRARLKFEVLPKGRRVQVSWPGFHHGMGISADIFLHQAQDHESMIIVIPIKKRRFYYNQKINCLPAEGNIRFGDIYESLSVDTCLGSLDWGRGIWEYKSFWNWASASGFMPGGGTVGLNLGCGFGDLSAATENCLVLDGKVHKLDQVSFKYDPGNYLHPWKFTDSEGRVSVDFVPFTERVAKTNLAIITSEVHQVFGKYSGTILTKEGMPVQINNLIGFAEEHQARW